MINYGAKLLYLYKHQKYRCPICNNFMTFSEPLDLHHKHSKTKWAIKKHPLFINSIMNLALVHDHCHLNKVGGLRVTSHNAEKHERFLQRHKKIADFVNMVDK